MIKKSLVFVIFALASFVIIGIVFSVVEGISVEGKEHTSVLSWIVIAYVAGLSMIVLPCTLPLVFIIVPLSMGKGYKKGLFMALLFGLGLTITITIYGIGVAALGQTTSLDTVSTYMFLVAGIAAFVFGLSQLGLIKVRIPSYSGTPGFIQKKSDYAKSFLMGILLGNAGVGCPNPLFYWLLIYIAGTGSMEIGASMGLTHGIGRAIPLILLSVLAIIGINYTKTLTSNRIRIETVTGFMLIIIGSFLIINGIPQGHEWYEETIVHQFWNELVELTSIPSEYGMESHEHDHHDERISKNHIPIILVILITTPFAWYIRKRIRK